MILDVQHKVEDDVSSEIARNCLLTRTRQISRVLTAIYDEQLRPFGINACQFTLLVLIVEFAPLSRSDLGRRNFHDRSTLTRNLRPLISQGLVSEDVPGNDGRSRAFRRRKKAKHCSVAPRPRGRLPRLKARPSSERLVPMRSWAWRANCRVAHNFL